MTAFRQVFLGFFIRHVPTKLLALLLALVVFVFVRNSQQGPRTIDNLELTFRLQGDARQKFVIENPVLILEVTLMGVRTHVDQAVLALGDETKVQIPLDENLLEAIGVNLTEPVPIPIDVRVLTRLEIIPTALVRIEAIEFPQMLSISKRIEVELAVTTQELKLSAKSTWTAEDGSDIVRVAFKPATVRIAGPERILKSLATLEVQVPDINSTLVGSANGKILDARITGINWRDMAIDDDDRATLEVLQPEDVAIEDLGGRIRYGFNVKDDIGEKKISQLKIRLLTPLGFDLDRWVPQNLEAIVDLQEGVIDFLTVRGPKNVLADEEFLKRLVAVIDVAGAEDDGERKIAYIHLDLAELRTASPDDLNKLRQLTIPPKGERKQQPALQLTPK